jgi:16S rRNA (adenine(1408)-N(1))-methyltransferase
MTLTRVVGKGRTTAIDADELSALRASADRVVVDVGTGDGRYAYDLASAHPDWLVIGIDALDEPMGEIAHRASRKPAKGGRANVLFVRAAAEALPAELHGIADEVHVLLPWGRLLEGVVLADEEVLGGLAALGRPGARVDVTLNGEIWEASMPVRYEQLPVPTPQYVTEVVAPGFARVGIELGPARYLSAEEAKGMPTTWARKLGHGRAHPRFVHFSGTRVV